MFQSFFRTKGKIDAGIEKKVGEIRRVSSISPTSSSTIAVPGRLRGMGLKIPIHTRPATEPTQQAAFCLPSCPVDEDMHRPGLYLHQGKYSNASSFLFGANNPPPDVKAAHDRFMMGDASEEDEELILSFLAHHPFRAGNITDKIFFSKDEQLVIEGNPLSFTDPEVEPTTFVPIRVAPIKPA
ncbi:MAG: hypothetical protein Q9166_000199 [cf. Caloplaca sp. 2 TL-2023]